MRSIILPSVVPFFLAGGRITLGVAWQVTLFGEYLMGVHGIGFQISGAIGLLEHRRGLRVGRLGRAADDRVRVRRLPPDRVVADPPYEESDVTGAASPIEIDSTARASVFPKDGEPVLDRISIDGRRRRARRA